MVQYAFGSTFGWSHRGTIKRIGLYGTLRCECLQKFMVVQIALWPRVSSAVVPVADWASVIASRKLTRLGQ